MAKNKWDYVFIFSSPPTPRMLDKVRLAVELGFCVACCYLKRPNQILFSYLENDICIGYGGLVNISWHDKRAEMSFLLNTDLTKDIHIYESYFFTYIDLLKEITFEYLKFNKLFTETYDFREGHIRILEKKKFVLEGELKQHISLNNKYYSSLIHAILKDEKKWYNKNKI